MATVGGFERWFLKIQFGGRARLSLYRKIQRYLRNGVSITQALETMWNYASDDGRKPKNIQAVVIESWLANIRNGQSFGTAIQAWVPRSERAVIDAGEQAGKLAEAIENACLLFESGRKIQAAVLAGVAYPVVLILVAVGFLIVFGTQVIPSFDAIVPRAQWTGLAGQMAMMSDFVNSGLIPTAGAIIALVAVIIWSMPRWTGRLRSRIDNIPPFSIYRLVNGASFLLSMAALVQAGVKVTNVLRIMAHGASPWYAERIRGTLAHVNNGLNIGDSLYKTGLNFPDKETVNDLRSYAMLDGFDEMLMKLGRENLEETITRIQAQSAILRNAGIVILGGVFMWIAAGIFSLQQMITSGL